MMIYLVRVFQDIEPLTLQTWVQLLVLNNEGDLTEITKPLTDSTRCTNLIILSRACDTISEPDPLSFETLIQ